MNFAGRILNRFGLGGGMARIGEGREITFDDFSEMPDPRILPPLDRPDVDEAKLTPEQQAWRRDGVVILRDFIPDTVLDPYIARRERLKDEGRDLFLGGWRSPSPYEHVPELRAVGLYPPLMRTMEQLVGEPMLMHLNLTGWVSTERNWHQDDYLNPGFVNSWYAAAWIALGDIDGDMGPFEYVPGSHAWPLMRQRLVMACMDPQERNRRDPTTRAGLWPKLSESFVVPAIAAEMARREAKIERFLARKGDVLIWHGRLMHRGSLATVPGTLRRSLIVHYSGVNHRPDFRSRAKDENGMNYAVFNAPLV